MNKKILICYETILKGGINNSLTEKFKNEPLIKLITNVEEVKNFLKTKEEKIFQFLYFICSVINDILYKNDELIDLDEFKVDNNKLSELFYLDLILMHNTEIYNFEYSFDLIKNINDIQKNNNEQTYKKMMYSKIILDLINNFQKEEEIDENSFEEIKNINENIIEENIDSFNEFNIDKNIFESEKIDEIYSTILVELIRKNKFDDYDYVVGILDQLDYKNIFLTDSMLEKIKNTLNSSEEFINKYEISDFYELINDNIKTNFYYLFYKYILKHPFYIYQIDFFEKFRKNLIGWLKSKYVEINDKLKKISDNNIKEKFFYIIKSFSDSDYYYEIVINPNLKKKKSENNTNKISYNKTEENAKKMLEKFELKIYFNKNNIKNEDNKAIIREYKKQMKSINDLKIEEINNRELKKNFSRFKKFVKEFDIDLNSIEKIINDNLGFHFSFNKNGENKVPNYYNITCKFELIKKEENKPYTTLKSFITNDFLNYGIIESQGFLYLKKYLIKLKKNTPTDLGSTSNSSFLSLTSQISGLKSYNKTKFYNFIDIRDYLNKKKNCYEIITLEKVLFQHRNSAELVIETNSNNFISIGMDDTIIVYNKNYTKIKELTVHDGETKYDKFTIEKDDIILYTRYGVYSLKVDESKENKAEMTKILNYPTKFFTQLSDKSYILVTYKNFKILKSLEQEIINDNYYFNGGIQLGKNSAAFTSNSTLPEGKDEIYFYFSEQEKISENIISGEYSFTTSNHSMELMPNKKGEKSYLLCGCKKYKEGQKNGILLIDLNNYRKQFYDTDNFEVYCFCSLYIIIERKSKEKEKNPKTFSTNYFLVGGSETDKKRGAIKLFKLNYKDDEEENDDKNDNIDKDLEIIEFVDDIEFNNTTEKKNKKFGDYFTGFNRNISCITQSKKTGKLLITSWDGYVYLFSAPNISYYLNQDNEDKKDKL